MRTLRWSRFRFRDQPAVGLLLVLMFGAQMGFAADGDRGRGQTVDQSLAGLTVGDRLAKVRRLYPGMQADGGSEPDSLWSQQVGGCVLNVSSERPMRDNDPIDLIAVTRLGNKELGACADIRTGRGLSMSDGLPEIRELYGDGLLSEDGLKIVFWVNDADQCMSGRSQTLRSIRVFWPMAEQRIESIVVEGSRGSCEDYKAGQADLSSRPNNVPDEIHSCVSTLGIGYKISNRINPFYLRGDFDGDGQPDYAVLVTKGSDQGIVVCRSSSQTNIVGAGEPFHGRSDLNFPAWKVHPRRRIVERDVEEGPLPKLRGDAIVIQWEEVNALVYWDGKKFSWYQLTD
jgi:hypothetical protein